MVHPGDAAAMLQLGPNAFKSSIDFPTWLLMAIDPPIHPPVRARIMEIGLPAAAVRTGTLTAVKARSDWPDVTSADAVAVPVPSTISTFTPASSKKPKSRAM